jgi:hypothetical protein
MFPEQKKMSTIVSILVKKNIGIEVRFQMLMPRQYNKNKLLSLRNSFLIHNLLATLSSLYILRSTERRRIKAINPK